MYILQFHHFFLMEGEYEVDIQMLDLILDLALEDLDYLDVIFLILT